MSLPNKIVMFDSSIVVEKNNRKSSDESSKRVLDSLAYTNTMSYYNKHRAVYVKINADFHADADVAQNE